MLGRYSPNLESQPSDLNLYQRWLLAQEFKPDWAVCAFGENETNCLVSAHKLGGKIASVLKIRYGIKMEK